MKTKRHHLILSLCLLIASPAFSSMQMLMGGGAQGPAEDDMNFTVFFQKAHEKFTLAEETIFLSGDNTQSLGMRVHIVRDGAKKPEDWPDTQPWLTQKQIQEMTTHLPHLSETNDAKSLFTAFLNQLIEETLGKEALYTTKTRLNLAFANAASQSTSRLADILEQEQESELNNEKRPQFTKEFLLNTLHEVEERESRAQQNLFNRLMSGGFTHKKLYYAPGGYVLISLESYTTPQEVLENEVLLKFAQRVPLEGVTVLAHFQEWFEATCNESFKTHVYNKSTGHMYQ